MSVIDRLAAMSQSVRELLSRRTAEQLSRKPKSSKVPTDITA